MQSDPCHRRAGPNQTLLSQQNGKCLAAFRKESDAAVLWVKSVSDVGIATAAALLMDAANCTQSIKIITDSRLLRLGILDPLLAPWKWRFEARRFHLKIISHQASLAYGRHVEADYWFKKGPTLIGESFTEEQLRRKGRISELRLLAINRA